MGSVKPIEDVDPNTPRPMMMIEPKLEPIDEFTPQSTTNPSFENRSSNGLGNVKASGETGVVNSEYNRISELFRNAFAEKDSFEDPDCRAIVPVNDDDDTQLSSANMCFIYIPFETLWFASGNKEGRNPNDYYMFEVSAFYTEEELCWGVRLEYENKDRRWRRKQRATQCPKLFPVPQKDTAVTTEIGCPMVLEPSLPSSSRASAEHDIATDRGLYLGYEKKALEVDQATMAILKERKSQNVELISVCGSTSRKMDDASRKRKRKRNRKRKRKRKRKIAGADESSLHDFDGS